MLCGGPAVRVEHSLRECRGRGECIAAMEGRWFNERQLSASLFDGHRKRAPPPEDDTERMERLKRPVEPPQMPPPGVPDADGFVPSSSSTKPLEQAEDEACNTGGCITD